MKMLIWRYRPISWLRQSALMARFSDGLRIAKKPVKLDFMVISSMIPPRSVTFRVGYFAARWLRAQMRARRRYGDAAAAHMHRRIRLSFPAQSSPRSGCKKVIKRRKSFAALRDGSSPACGGTIYFSRPLPPSLSSGGQSLPFHTVGGACRWHYCAQHLLAGSRFLQRCRREPGQASAGGFIKRHASALRQRRSLPFIGPRFSRCAT